MQRNIAPEGRPSKDVHEGHGTRERGMTFHSGDQVEDCTAQKKTEKSFEFRDSFIPQKKARLILGGRP